MEGKHQNSNKRAELLKLRNVSGKRNEFCSIPSHWKMLDVDRIQLVVKKNYFENSR